MSNWYYADAEHQRQGPLQAEEMGQRFHQGRLRLDTLVWREGLAEWQPLRHFTQELALHQAPAETFYTPVDAAPAEERSARANPPAAWAGVSGAQPSAMPDSPYAPPAAPLASFEAVQIGDEVVHAGFWKRVAASTIDGLLITAVLLAVLAVGAVLLGIGMNSVANDVASGAIGGFFILGVYGVPIVLQAIYFTWMHGSSHQATLGKMAVGIKVVQGNGQRIGTGRSLGRWAGYFFMHLFSCGITSLVSAFTVGLGLRKQALHDMVADTLVVDRWAYTAHPERQRHELGPVTIGVIVLLVLLVVGYIVLLGFVGAMAGRAG